jgi:hypothetical protein
MFALDLIMLFIPWLHGKHPIEPTKKPTWPILEVFSHVGLLVNEPSSRAGLLFISSADDV